MKSPRRVMLAFLCLPVLAGCGAGNGSPTSASSGIHPVALPAAFQGEWFGHGRHLTVKGDGTGVMIYRMYQWCTAIQTTGCDTVAGNVITDGGHDDIVFTQVQGRVASGTIRTSTTPRLAGSAVTFAVHVDGTGLLHQAKQPDAGWTLCGPNAVNVQNYCGA